MENQLASVPRGEMKPEESAAMARVRFLEEHYDVIQTLPLVEALQADSDLLETLVTDLHCLVLQNKCRESLSVSIALDVKDGYGRGHASKDTLELKVALKEATELVQSQAALTCKVVDAHFRRKSLEHHPDRVGPGEEDAFEALTNARTILRDARLRRLYLQQMIQVAQKVSPLLVESCHLSWMSKYAPSLVAKGAAAVSSPKRIQSGVDYDRPSRPQVQVLNRNKCHIQVELQVMQDVQDLQQIQVMASCPDFEKEVILQSLSKEEVELVREEDSIISIDATLPINGMWNIYWHATFVSQKEQVTTPSSIQVAVDLSSEDQLRHRATIRATDELAKQRAGDIQHTLQKLRGAHFTDNIEKRHQALHGVMARGRSTLQYLNNMLEKDGLLDKKDMNGLITLERALEVANDVKQNLDARYKAVTSKSNLKGFKAHVESLLESGEAAAWIRSVSEQDLQSLGGTANRLYQLLVDHQSLVPAIISALSAACSRHGLFTPKQCELLETRKMEKKEQISQAAQDALEQAAQKSKGKHDADYKGDGDELVPGDVVEIASLSSSKGQLYNDTLGMILQKKGDGRYIVQSQENGHHLSLDASKLSKWQSHALRDSWECKACTLLHEGPRSNATFCDACQTPRGENLSSMNDGDLTLKEGDLTTLASGDDESWEEVPIKNDAWEKLSTKRALPLQKSGRSSLSAVTKKEPPKKVAADLCRFGANCRYGANCKFSHPHDDDEVSALTSLSSPVTIVAKEANYEKHQFSIPAGIAGWIIGKGATRLYEIRETCGAMVRIDKSGQNRTVTVSGKPKAVARGVKMIKDIVSDFGGSKHGTSPTSATDTLHTSPTVASSTDTLNSPDDDESHVNWRPLSPCQEQPLLEQSHMSTHDETNRESFVTEPGINQNDDVYDVEDDDTLTQADSYVADIPKQADLHAVDEAPPFQASANESVLPKRVAAPVWQQAVGTQAAASDLKPVSLNQVLDQRAIVPKPSNHYVSDDNIPNQAPVKLAKPKPSAYHDKGIPKTIRTPARGMDHFYASHSSVPQMPATALNETFQPIMSNDGSQSTDSALLVFLKEQEALIKGTPQDFCEWLVESESISSLDDLAEAVGDEDYLKNTLKSGDGKVGVKGFKLKKFVQAVTDALVEPNQTKTQNRQPVRDLMCPISHRLMVHNPVLAADGITYERDAIVDYFKKEQWGIQMALSALAAGKNVDLARSIMDRGIVSPITGERLPHLHLVPNHVCLAMSREKAGL